MATAAIALAPGVYRIPTTRFDLVNTFAFLDDDGGVTLVDSGVRSAPPRIVAALAELGKGPRDVRRIILTHAHEDHAGGAFELARATGAAPSLHVDDAPSARTGYTPPRDATFPLARLFNRVLARKRGFSPFVAGPNLHDGELLEVAGGLRVVHTPGHSPGHVSLLHEPSRVLITGDAIFNVRRLRWPVRQFCSDFALTMETAQRLGELDYTVAAFTYGPHVSERAREQVRTFLAAAR
jgi:glyoxylase-like metal-dependent hydrolase (beta-lactamase superfamily II)